MTPEEKAEKYDELLLKLQKAKVDDNVCDERYCCVIDDIVPELKESEDEKIRKVLIDYFKRYKEQEECGIKTFYGIPADDILAWLEKQGTPAKLSEEEQNRFAKSVLTSCAMSFISYLDAHKYEGKMCVSNGECADIENAFHNSMWDKLHRYYCKYIEKQNEQNHANSTKACKDEQNPTDKIEPKFKIKYASSEYNVLEVKDIAGVTYYGIEDEPNHIDYVQAENCERVDGYSIKESGSPFPTKPAKFSEQNSAWSEEDENIKEWIMSDINKLLALNRKSFVIADKEITWLKSLKDRVGCEANCTTTKEWKPSDEQMEELKYVTTLMGASKFPCEHDYCYNVLKTLQEQLKKLK